jgi:hypothetical protein
MKVLVAVVHPEIAIVKRKLSELQPSFGDLKKRRSVLGLCIFGKPEAFVRATVVVYPDAHVLHRRVRDAVLWRPGYAVNRGR